MNLKIALLLAPLWAAFFSASALADQSDDQRDPLEERLDALEQELLDLQEEAREARRTTLHGFGHVGYFAASVDFGGNLGERDANAFANGGLDLFLNSRLSDRISFLNETLFEPTEEGENVLDVERVILKIRFNDHINLHMGRVHTTLGHWNEAYHHGEWLQASIGRPRLFDFEDEDGVLPVHLIGLVLTGRASSDAGTIRYTLEAGNGRGATPDPPQIITDANEHKAFNASLNFEPAILEGLRFGGGVYLDEIPANVDGDAGPTHGELDESVFTAFVAFENRRFELLAEYVDIRHDEGALEASSSGYYVQLALRQGALKPYLRVDTLDVDDQDSFFTSNDDLLRFGGGLRWDYSSWAALKLQVDRATVEPSSGDPDVESLAFLVQNAFAF